MNEHTPPGTRRNKIATAAEAVRLIHDGDTVATDGFLKARLEGRTAA